MIFFDSFIVLSIIDFYFFDVIFFFLQSHFFDDSVIH